MVEPEILELLTQSDDELLADIVSTVVRRHLDGFRPALVVSVNDRNAVVSDAYVHLDDAEELIAFLHEGGLRDGAKPGNGQN